MIYGNKFLYYGKDFSDIDLFLQEAQYNDSSLFTPLFEGSNVVFLDEGVIGDKIKGAIRNIGSFIKEFFKRIKGIIEEKFRKIKIRKAEKKINNKLSVAPFKMEFYDYDLLLMEIESDFEFGKLESVIGGIIDSTKKEFKTFRKDFETPQDEINRKAKEGNEHYQKIKDVHDTIDRIMNDGKDRRDTVSATQFWNELIEKIDKKIVNGFPDIMMSGLGNNMTNNSDVKTFKKEFDEYCEDALNKKKQLVLIDSTYKAEALLKQSNATHAVEYKSKLLKICDQYEKELNAILKDIEDMQKDESSLIIQNSGFISFLNAFKSAINKSIFPALTHVSARITGYVSRLAKQCNTLDDIIAGNIPNQNIKEFEYKRFNYEHK